MHDIKKILDCKSEKEDWTRRLSGDVIWVAL